MSDSDSILGKDSDQVDEFSSGSTSREEGVNMDIIPNVREDLIEEVIESNLPHKGRYEWVSLSVTSQFSLFRWLRWLESWLRFIRVFEKDASQYIVSLEWVSTVERVSWPRTSRGGILLYVHVSLFATTFAFTI